ncbi:hypothetical protein ABT010_03460 [Streptomyces sp. NPDC002668]|uniref:hypothetical protein n=1 Tax=Streptomyces sp. NPDC002668 TaxID=3154422 RepID=UPI00331777BD
MAGDRVDAGAGVPLQRADGGVAGAGGIGVEARGVGSFDNVGSLRDLKVTGKPAGKWHHAVRVPPRTGPDGVAVERGAE